MWVFIVPYTILSLPVILMDRKNPERRTTGERAGTGVIIWFILFMLISMLSWIGLFFVTPVIGSAYMDILATGGIGWLFSIGFGALEGYKALKDWNYRRKIKYNEDGYRIWDEPKEKHPSIIKEFIKAKYNKYCPKIDWNNNK
jgi:polyferredoxin